MTKKQLRQQIKQLKAMTPVALRHVEADMVFKTIQTMPVWKQAQHILCYWSLPDELPTHEAVNQWQLIIVPAVALDANRNRLGRGKGFYDRLLNSTTCPTIGVVCDFQLVDEVPVEPHDQPLDCVVTSDDVYCDETKRQLFE